MKVIFHKFDKGKDLIQPKERKNEPDKSIYRNENNVQTSDAIYKPKCA